MTCFVDTCPVSSPGCCRPRRAGRRGPGARCALRPLGRPARPCCRTRGRARRCSGSGRPSVAGGGPSGRGRYRRAGPARRPGRSPADAAGRGAGVADRHGPGAGRCGPEPEAGGGPDRGVARGRWRRERLMASRWSPGSSGSRPPRRPAPRAGQRAVRLGTARSTRTREAPGRCRRPGPTAAVRPGRLDRRSARVLHRDDRGEQRPGRALGSPATTRTPADPTSSRSTPRISRP